MAVLEINALSTALSGSFSVTVIAPENTVLEENKLYPALYFIHEIGGDDSDIRTVKGLEHIADEHGIFVIAPSVMHSFARDLRWGGKYATFVSRELPGICRHLFPLDESRQYIGGIGSGAYAAYLQAGEHPDIFGKCVALDGHFNIPGLCENAAKGLPLPHLTPSMVEAVFPELLAVRGSRFDVFSSESDVPKHLFLGCQEDFVGYSGCADLAKTAQTTLHIAKNEGDLFEAAIRWL